MYGNTSLLSNGNPEIKVMKLIKGNIDKLIAINDHGKWHFLWWGDHILHNFPSMIQSIPSKNIYSDTFSYG